MSRHQWLNSCFFWGGRYYLSQGVGRSFGARGLKDRERGWDFWEGDSEPSPHQLWSLRKRHKLSLRGPGWSPGKLEIWCNLRPQKSLQKCLIMYGSRTIRTLDCSYRGLFVPSLDFSYPGLFVPWTIRTTTGRFVPCWERQHSLYSVSQKNPPWGFLTFFPKMVGNFQSKFYMPIVRSYLR